MGLQHRIKKRIGFTFLMIKLGGLFLDMKVEKLMLMPFYGVGSWYHLHIGFRQDLIIRVYHNGPALFSSR